MERPHRRHTRPHGLSAALTVLSAVCLTGCTAEIQTVSLGIDDYYIIPRMTKLHLQSEFTGNNYRWIITGPDGTKVNGSDNRELIFLQEREGEYVIEFDVVDHATPFHHEFRVNVVHEDVEFSPRIAKVYDYRPAPGQFVNEMPRYEPGDTYADMVKKTEESISGDNNVLVSLGAFGGYVTFGFDHTVINGDGYDFSIDGNAFYELGDTSRPGGSSEPGIVYVSYDRNMNGLPDDEWYELAGSEYHSPDTLHGYSVTYTRPDEDKAPDPDLRHQIAEKSYIPWRDSLGESGFVARNIFHSQSYFPLWVEEDDLTFTGCRLAPNAVDTDGKGTYYILYSYPWGYADNHPNDRKDLNSFDISNAVDATGNPVDLPGVDFIKVMTALNQYNGWLGETSTEISGATDLHLVTPEEE